MSHAKAVALTEALIDKQFMDFLNEALYSQCSGLYSGVGSMKKAIFTCFAVLIFSMSIAYAAQPPTPVQSVGPYPRLNTVHFDLIAEQWVSTDTAKVVVSIDANLGAASMDRLQESVLRSLKKLANQGEWRITQFSRNQDRSELERVYIQAEARLPADQLAGIRISADQLSKPGMKYSVSQIDYSPSLSEIEAVKNQVRDMLYQQAKTQIDKLNKIYGQKFYLNNLQFNDGGIPPRPAARYKQAATLASSTEQFDGAGGASMAVSQKIIIAASITVASTI